jgi:hypothetical protein
MKDKIGPTSQDRLPNLDHVPEIAEFVPEPLFKL